MKRGESIGFSTRLCTFFAEQDRIFSNYVRAKGQLTYSELTLLAALHEAQSVVGFKPLSDYLMLSPRTVSAMLLSLEDRGLVTKYDDPTDGRYMQVGLSNSGRITTEEFVSGIYALIKELLWEALPESDFSDVLKVSIRNCVNSLRGFTVDPFGNTAHTDLPISADHFILWRVIVDRWSQAVKKKSALSLNDFRTLYYVYECGKLSSGEIADALFLPRSALSLCKKHLLARGLLQQQTCSQDKRRLLLSCTPKGKQRAKSTFELLDEITRDAHSSMSEEVSYLVNAWYARMFSNMQRLRK